MTVSEGEKEARFIAFYNRLSPEDQQRLRDWVDKLPDPAPATGEPNGTQPTDAGD